MGSFLELGIKEKRLVKSRVLVLTMDLIFEI